jgi:alkylation response protein AidB-like acyl-CoA dehydrogenase
VKKMAALGLLGIQWPEQYGGAAMSAIDYCICIEEIARVDPAVALSLAAHNGLCSSHLFRFGTEAQKQQFLVPLARGEKVGAWGLTESTSGSDAAGMRTTATRAGACWVLNGSKTFITHGRICDVMVVMAVTDRAAGTRGISAFVVEQGTPGMAPGKKEDKLGMRASDTSEVLFDNCRIPSDQLVGTEGQGFVDTMQVLDAGRIGIAALAVGLAQGAYEAALSYARERKAFGKPIAGFQAIQWKLADAATKIEAARLLTYRAAFLKERGQRTTLESAMAKLYASEIAVKVADDCVQIHGGYGFVKDYPAEKYFRDVKLTTIGEGTSEILRLVIARQLLSR